MNRSLGRERTKEILDMVLDVDEFALISVFSSTR